MLMTGPSGGNLNWSSTTGDRSHPDRTATGKWRKVVDLEAFRSGNLICKNAFELKSEGQGKHGNGDGDFHILGGFLCSLSKDLVTSGKNYFMFITFKAETFNEKR
jgi:hypothetical protein